MAYVDGFKHDLFVSYAHGDNIPRGRYPLGWVTKLREEIEAEVQELGLRDFSLFMDYQGLASNFPLSDQLMQAIKDSAVLLVVLSPAYISSEWCQREKNAFLKEISPKSGRVFVAEKHPPKADPAPPELEGLLGIRFYGKGADGLLLQFSPDDDEFLRAVKKLGDHLERQLRKMKPSGVERPDSESVTATQTRTLVFLAEVLQGLDRSRDKVKTSLGQYGVDVVPASYYRGDDDEVRSKVQADLKQCDFFIQLLSDSPDPRARLQFDIAKESGKKMFVWRDPEIDLDRVRDPEYRSFLEEQVRAETLTTFEKTVREEVLRPPPPKPTNRSAAIGSYVFVYYDDDRPIAEAVMKALAEHDAAGIAISPADAEGAEAADRELKNEMVDCAVMILIRGENDSWVKSTYKKLVKILPEVLERRKDEGKNDLPVAVYDGPPAGNPPPLLTHPRIDFLDCTHDATQLDQFLNGLFGGTE